MCEKQYKKKEAIMRFRDQYSFLSNMSNSTFILNDIIYKSVEHFYQSHKAKNISERIAIINASTPTLAKKLGVKCKLCDEWGLNYKLAVMRLGLKLKFQQNPTLTFRLLEINEPIIEDNDWNDTFWGMYKGYGLNNLGKLLDELKLVLELRISHVKFNTKYKETIL